MQATKNCTQMEKIYQFYKWTKNNFDMERINWIKIGKIEALFKRPKPKSA